jgi:hypothetical protein
MEEECQLAIVVFACNTVDKYVKQIEAINSTWGKKCQEYSSVHILFFFGEERVEGAEFEDTPNTKYVHLPGVGNDYLSASYKQWMGLKYAYDHYKPNFTICIGTDTYLNIPALLSFIDIYNPNSHLYIGGHSDARQIGDTLYKFHSGGPGFIITRAVLEKLYPMLLNAVGVWINVCCRNGVENLIPACDVSIAYYVNQPDYKAKYIQVSTGFTNCNYYGYPCCLGKIDIAQVVSCHFMSIQDFHVFTGILEANNYFIQ